MKRCVSCARQFLRTFQEDRAREAPCIFLAKGVAFSKKLKTSAVSST